MAVDVAQTKLWRDVTMYENVTCHRHVHANACVRVYVCVCARVCVINENKHPFQNFCFLIHYTALIYPSNRQNFCHVGLSFCHVVMWHHVQCPIARFNHNLIS